MYIVEIVFSMIYYQNLLSRYKSTKSVENKPDLFYSFFYNTVINGNLI